MRLSTASGLITITALMPTGALRMAQAIRTHHYRLLATVEGVSINVVCSHAPEHQATS